MSDHTRLHNLPVNDGLHPLIYTAMVALIAWLVLSVWVLFGSGAYVGLILTMITVFFVIVTGIPTLIWLSWRHNTNPEAQGHAESFRNWATHPFSTWTETLSGRAAAAQILLPLAAVAFGMTTFGLVYVLTVP
jgi:amino acid transporter